MLPSFLLFAFAHERGWLGWNSDEPKGGMTEEIWLTSWQCRDIIFFFGASKLALNIKLADMIVILFHVM
jgi:hypothetical protein